MNEGVMRETGPTSPASSIALGVVMALVPAICLGVLLLRPIWDVDIFWQLKLGELILAARGPITTEPFAASHLGEPLPAVAWLGQAVFAGVRLLSGWTGLRLFDALCWIGGFWLVALACLRRGARPGAVALALAASFIAALPAASIRPQTFGALCFGALLALLKADWPNGRKVALGLALLIGWQNLHPSVSIGALALAAHAGAGWLTWWRRRTAERPWASTVLTPIAVAAMFATPDGWGILAVSARNAQASISVGASEWLPLWTPANHVNAVPVLAVTLLAALSAWRARDRLCWQDAAVMLALLIATVTAYRFVLFWAIATVPVLALSAERNRSEPPRIGLAALGIALVALILPVARPTHFSENLPLAAVARLKQAGVQGTIFTEPEFGGVLIDAGHPRWHVSLDGRYYRYTDVEWARYGLILAGEFPLRAIEHTDRPAAFLLRPSHSTTLSGELNRPGSGWRRIWRDEGAAVWIPR